MSKDRPASANRSAWRAKKCPLHAVHRDPPLKPARCQRARRVQAVRVDQVSGHAGDGDGLVIDQNRFEIGEAPEIVDPQITVKNKYNPRLGEVETDVPSAPDPDILTAQGMAAQPRVILQCGTGIRVIEDRDHFAIEVCQIAEQRRHVVLATGFIAQDRDNDGPDRRDRYGSSPECGHSVQCRPRLLQSTGEGQQLGLDDPDVRIVRVELGGAGKRLLGLRENAARQENRTQPGPAGGKVRMGAQKRLDRFDRVFEAPRRLMGA